MAGIAPRWGAWTLLTLNPARWAGLKNGAPLALWQRHVWEEERIGNDAVFLG